MLTDLFRKGSNKFPVAMFAQNRTLTSPVVLSTDIVETDIDGGFILYRSRRSLSVLFAMMTSVVRI